MKGSCIVYWAHWKIILIEVSENGGLCCLNALGGLESI